jgi:hypothetical protein
MTVPHFGRYGRYSATNEELAAGARRKTKPQPEVEASDWGRKGFCYRQERLG